MEPVHPEFAPDASLDRDEMEALQREIAERAVFRDDFEFDSERVWPVSESGQRELGDTAGGDSDAGDSPVVVGVDQAFLDDERAVSALVALRDGEVIERAHAVAPTEIPYIPGLLSFREGGAILSGFRELSVEPDLAVFDGSGRIHFREAGIATHVGVMLDLPSIGVAKNLLCGRPAASTDGLVEGERVAIEADGDVTAPDGTVIGYAVQSRQYDSPNRYINPLIVSPGHRVSAATAADLTLSCSAGYKLPEPTRLADKYADDLKSEIGD
ncbi:endonuclease V [Halorientalis sp. IM1011]|uniref:endonuclease V n=1 Tax=Halorientalis sp. IM1011 TaxID=1932360 RepID=UPI00097CCCEA|nr:endonuclease V [Halorientalis sp. IM1011]AQL41886.1 endonuclease V [Halorientalis sp. IM1011]